MSAPIVKTFASSAPITQNNVPINKASIPFLLQAHGSPFDESVDYHSPEVQEAILEKFGWPRFQVSEAYKTSSVPGYELLTSFIRDNVFTAGLAGWVHWSGKMRQLLVVAVHLKLNAKGTLSATDMSNPYIRNKQQMFVMVYFDEKEKKLCAAEIPPPSAWVPGNPSIKEWMKLSVLMGTDKASGAVTAYLDEVRMAGKKVRMEDFLKTLDLKPATEWVLQFEPEGHLPFLAIRGPERKSPAKKRDVDASPSRGKKEEKKEEKKEKKEKDVRFIKSPEEKRLKLKKTELKQQYHEAYKLFQDVEFQLRDTRRSLEAVQTARLSGV